MPTSLSSIVKSWLTVEEGEHTLAELLAWVRERNANTHVEIQKSAFVEGDQWFLDDMTGAIRRQDGTFFSIQGLRQTSVTGETHEQPVVVQPEIGYLGFLASVRHGVLHLLVQAKIEPGNINKVQLSPTIQATKSNFTRAHGGKAPAYLEHFVSPDPSAVIVDQIQSEQSSRFVRKRNRNIIVEVAEAPELTERFRWMTIGQLKALMRYDNLVNMDSRTVLSCLPTSLLRADAEDVDALRAQFEDPAFAASVLDAPAVSPAPRLFHQVNNYKMFETPTTELVRLDALKRWEWVDGEFVCLDGGDFTVGVFDITIEGREVVHWRQPLLKARGIATFCLITSVEADGVRRFAVRANPEPGCFDGIEIGPTVQLEPTATVDMDGGAASFTLAHAESHPERVLHDVLLSEEGGRFYHEENRNLVVDVPREELEGLLARDPGLVMVDYYTLNLLNQVNNVLNVQLRNMLSLLTARSPEEGVQ